ncbi:MAG: hypothetical protein ABSG16_16160 [Candidatus Acidiferrum sp.]|jgi:hypothetical protein
MKIKTLAWVGAAALALLGLSVSARADLISADTNDTVGQAGNLEWSAPVGEAADSGAHGKTCACRFWGLGSGQSFSSDFSLLASAQLGGSAKNGKSLPGAAVDRLGGDGKVAFPVSTDDAGSTDEADASDAQSGSGGYGNGVAYSEAVAAGGIPASGLVVAKAGPGGPGTVSSSSDPQAYPFRGSGKTFRPEPVDPILRSGSPVSVSKPFISDVSEPEVLTLLAMGCTALGLLLLKRAS